MPWTLGEDGSGMQLRFVRPSGGGRSSNAENIMWQQTGQVSGMLQHALAQHQQGGRAVSGAAVARWLPANADPGAVDFQNTRSMMSSNIYKPSIFGNKPRRQQPLAAAPPVPPQWGEGNEYAGLQQAAAARRPDPEGFRLPLLPTDRLQREQGGSTAACLGGKQQQQGVGRGRVRPSPRAAQPSPRTVIAAMETMSTDELVEAERKRGPQLTPRTRKEEQMQVAREAQKKNMVMQHVKRLANKDWASRKAAVSALAGLVEEDASVLEQVMVLLDSRQDKTRQTAVWALSRIVDKGHPGAVEMILRRLEHPNSDVRLAALSALEHVAVQGGEGGVEGVLARLRHGDWTVREAAVDAMRHVAGAGDPEAVEGLGKCVRADGDWRVRQVAAEALQALLDPSIGCVREALACADAAADPQDGAARGPGAVQMTVGCYRGMMRACGVPGGVGQCCRECRETGAEDWFRCAGCVGGVRRWVGTKLVERQALAFAMGWHGRLGKGSCVAWLDPELLPCIMEHVMREC